MEKQSNAQDFKSKGGIRRIFKAGGYSWQGLRAAFRHESAFRQELLLVAALALLSFFISSSVLHWMLLVSTLFLVLIAELLNSAIESLADTISPEYHPLVGRAKDMGSAAVLLSLLCVGVVWVVSLLIKLNLL